MVTTTGPPLPLTTTFTPAIECLTDFWLLNSLHTGSRSLWANLGPADPQKCLPSAWSPTTYYSPGIICLSGWAMAGNYTSAGETIGKCCPIYQPSSWTFATRACCIDKFWPIIEACDLSATVDMNWTYKHTNTIGTTKTTTGSIVSGIDGWNAYGVELRWKSTDLTSAPVTAFVSSTTSAVMTPTTTIKATTQVSEEKYPSFLTGAKAGTGVRVRLGATLVILGIGFWILHGRKHRGHDGGKEPSELTETKNLTPQSAIHELDSNHVFEKDGVQGTRPQLKEPVELEGSSAILVDLDASYDPVVLV